MPEKNLLKQENGTKIHVVFFFIPDVVCIMSFTFTDGFKFDHIKVSNNTV